MPPIHAVVQEWAFFQYGYLVREELFAQSEEATGIVLQLAYTLAEGKYIGEPWLAKFLCEDHEITPESVTPTSTVCEVGWSPRDRVYYGWDGRHISGFSIGFKVEKDSPLTSVGVTIGFECLTRDDCRFLAGKWVEYLKWKKTKES